MRMKASGGSIRNERITAMQDVVDRLFADDPSYRQDVTVWGTGTIIPARVYEHKYRDSGTPRRQIQTPYNAPFSVGTIFQIGDEGHWICIEAYSAHQMNWQGTLEYCNYKLCFLLNKRVAEYPVVMKNATQYNSGETNKPQMVIGSSQHLIYIPCSHETLTVDRGTRFLIDKNRKAPAAYKVTQVDTTSYAYGSSGMLQWTVVEDQFSPTCDNAELMVANYYGYSENKEIGGYANDTANIESGGLW